MNPLSLTNYYQPPIGFKAYDNSGQKKYKCPYTIPQLINQVKDFEHKGNKIGEAIARLDLANSYFKEGSKEKAIEQYEISGEQFLDLYKKTNHPKSRNSAFYACGRAGDLITNERNKPWKNPSYLIPQKDAERALKCYENQLKLIDNSTNYNKDKKPRIQEKIANVKKYGFNEFDLNSYIKPIIQMQHSGDYLNAAYKHQELGALLVKEQEYDKGKTELEKALQMQKGYGHHKDVNFCYVLLRQITKSKPEKELEYCESHLNYLNNYCEHGYTKTKGALNKRIGELTSEENPEKALKSFNKAIEIYQKTDNKDSIADSKKSISIIYANMAKQSKESGNDELAAEQKAEGIKNINEAIKIFKDKKNNNSVCFCLEKKAYIYRQLGEFQKALPLYYEQLTYTDETTKPKALGTIHCHIGMALADDKPYEALEHFDTAITHYKKKNKYKLSLEFCENEKQKVIDNLKNTA